MFQVCANFFKMLINLADDIRHIKKELSEHKSRLDILTHDSTRHEAIIECYIGKKFLKK
jgi:hypothetical protein